MKNNVYIKQSRWREIFEDLKKQLEKNHFAIGERFYSINDICRIYQTSEITARRVFQELKRENWINPVRKKGTTIRRSARPIEIIFVARLEDTLEGKDWFWHEYVRMLETLKNRGKKENFSITPVNHTFFLSHLPQFKGKPLIIKYSALYEIATDFNKKNQKILDTLRNEFSVVIVNTQSLINGFCHIKPDFVQGGRLATEHLLEKGHKRIGYFSWDITIPIFSTRFKGYIEALEEKGISLDFSIIKATTGLNREEDWRALEELLSLPNPPTAIACANDSRALHILEYCKTRGIRVPQDLAITGFDNIPESAFAIPPLTTVDMETGMQAEKAFSLLVKKMTGKVSAPITLIVDQSLVVRNST